MTMTFVWTGVALWLALNAAVTVCLLAAAPGDRKRTFDRAPASTWSRGTRVPARLQDRC